MSESYFPFNSMLVNGSPDRPANAESLAAYFGAFFSNGILRDSEERLKVSAGSGLKVSVTPGSAVIGGRVYTASTVLHLSIDTANAALNRIDRVVIRLNLPKRLMEVAVVKGTPAASPTAPDLTRNVEIYEICIAEITVAAASTNIISSNIRDTRADEYLCGTSCCFAFDEVVQEVIGKLPVYGGVIA